MPKPVTELPRPEVKPDPELEKRTRRRFSAEYKLRILSEADRCQHGELSALLRREKLYSSQLQSWRKEFAEHGVTGLSKSRPGPAASMTAEQRRIAALEKENSRLKHELLMTNDCLDLQKKALSMLDRTNNGSDA
ncbi:transposase [soil metagenome]